jgi:hypothetical protein
MGDYVFVFIVFSVDVVGQFAVSGPKSPSGFSVAAISQPIHAAAQAHAVFSAANVHLSFLCGCSSYGRAIQHNNLEGEGGNKK